MPLTDAKVKNLKVGEKPYKVSDFDGLFVLVKNDLLPGNIRALRLVCSST